MNEGIKKGLIFGLVLIIIQVLLLIFNDGEPTAQFILWIIQLVAYFIASTIAAEAEYSKQGDFAQENLTQVAASGRGATMMICVLVWVYIILRSIILDDSGIFNNLGLFSFIFAVFDFVCAIGIGSLAGNIVKKKYNQYD
jgi:hypothetical protein